MKDGEGLDLLFRRWRQAWEAGDVAGLLELVAPDAEFWTHGAPPIVGRQALGQAFQSFFREFRSSQMFEEHERILAGDLAFVRGVEINALEPRAGGEAMEVRQRAFSVVRRRDDGGWVFFRGMTNQEEATGNP